MAFFFPQQTTQHPLLQLLEELERPSPQGHPRQQPSHSHSHRPQRPCPPQHASPTQTAAPPRFDVRERDESYELDGELPGVDASQLVVDCLDEYSVRVSGRFERAWTPAPSPAAAPAVETPSTEPVPDHHATVEDEYEDLGGEREQEQEEPSPAETQEPVIPAAAAASDRLWVAERPVGAFARTFRFPVRIEPAGITAGMRDGLLRVVVPKVRRVEGRRVAVSLL